ncbi:Ig-like domain-containing protein, partial [Harryflintia acetispora]
ELEWTNSDPGAAAMTVAADGRSATIDASGKTAGSTTITAHIKGAPDTAQYKASCTVTVVTIGSVSVSPNSYTLYTQGSPQTVQLAATVTPNAAPVWSSSNPAAATVNQTGLVTAVAAGSATVTATVGGKSGSSTITVKDKIPVASVTVSGTNSLVRTSDNLSPTTQLSASVEPENATLKTVTWVKTGGSGNINISTSGLVTATSAGSATFTATADGVTSTPYIVTVTDQKVTGITIRANDSVLTGKSISVSATVTPENAINTDITWSLTQSKNYASLSGQTLNGLESGDVFGTVTLRAVSNDGGASQTKTVRVTAANGSQVQWAGKSWRVADEDATQFGGKTGSVVLIGDIYETVEFGSNTYYYSTVRNRCLALYNSLTAAQKAKISNHAVVGDPVWVPNSYEIYGSSTPSWGLTPGDTLIRQLGYFANTGTTVSNTEPVRGIYQSYGSWLRVNYNNSGDSICRVLNGYLSYDKSTASKNAIHPALVLNP